MCVCGLNVSGCPPRPSFTVYTQHNIKIITDNRYDCQLVVRSTLKLASPAKTIGCITE